MSMKLTETLAYIRDVVYPYIKNIDTFFSENQMNIDTVANNIQNVNKTAQNEPNINAVNANKPNIDTIVEIKDILASLFADKPTLTSIFNDKATHDSLYADKPTLDGLFAIKTKLESLFADKPTLDSLYTDKPTLDGLFAIKAKLDSLFVNMDSMVLNANNMSAIQGALQNANDTIAAKAQTLIYRNQAEGFKNEAQAIAGGAIVASNVQFSDLLTLEAYRANTTNAINAINTLLASDDTSLDQIQELVDFIKANKATLDTLGIGNIAGLQAALDAKSTDLAAHANNKANPHEVTKVQVGLSNVDNTSDELKPLSQASKDALDLKADKTVVEAISEGLEAKVDVDTMTQALASISSGGVRQTVQYASVNPTTGQPNFISIGTGLSVNISATAKNVKISAAGGDVDRVGKIISDTAISGLSANAINYLYADIALDGTVTLGSTTIAPQYVGGLANYELTAQTPTMTSNTAPSGIASVSSSYGGGYEAYKVFDKTITSSWQTPSGTTTGWLQYQFPTAKRITKYKITDFGSATYAPNSWTFLGSNDGTTWTTLDTRSGIVFTNSETKYFTFSNAVSYLYYKINITANNGGSDLGIGELELYSPIAGTNVFDIANMEMFNFDGTNYTKAWRVFLAEAVTNASAVTSVVNYALNGLYKSAPVAFSGAGTFNFNHNIGDKVENLVPIAFGKASADTYFSANPLGYAGGSLYPIFTNNTATTKSIAVSTQSGGILIGGGATTTGFISITVKRGW